MRKTLSAVACCVLLAVASSKAQNPLLRGLENVASYISANGELRSGVGGDFNAIGHGKISPVMIQQITFYSRNFKHTGVDFGVAHMTTFSSDKNHESVGFSFAWKILDLQQLKNWKFPALKLAELRLGGSVGVDVDEAIQGRVSQRSAVAAVTAGWKF